MGDVMTPDRSRPVVHKHVQVREYVRGADPGAEPGSPAPSERELVQHFGVARMTVRQALDALVAEGLLERVPGRGTFVARAKIDVQVRLSSYTEEMGRRGHEARAPARCSPAWSRPAPEWPARSRSARATRSCTGSGCGSPTAPRCASRTPTSPTASCRSSSTRALPDSLYVELQRRDLLPTWGEDSVDAALARADEAELLEHPRGRPGAADRPPRVRRQHRGGGVPVDVPRRPVHALGAAVRAERPAPRLGDAARGCCWRRAPAGGWGDPRRCCATPTGCRSWTARSGCCSTADARR